MADAPAFDWPTYSRENLGTQREAFKAELQALGELVEMHYYTLENEVAPLPAGNRLKVAVEDLRKIRRNLRDPRI